MNILTIYTDGSSRGNPGPGGWAAILMTNESVVELAGAQDPATNNQMELEAVAQGLIYALKHFPDHTVQLHADSAYVLNGTEKWLDGWVRKKWVTMNKTPVGNKPQWEKILELRDGLGKRLVLNKVSGHSGHVYNDRCDELAVAEALCKKQTLFIGNVKQYEMYLEENPPKSEVKKSSSSSKKKNTETAYSYVSLVNGKVHADKTWAACEKRVKGTKGAKFKKVFSKAEETSLVHEYATNTVA